MGPRIVWRRSATAVGIYGSAILGILATVVAARELTKLDFSRFALVFALTGLLQLFLDLTVEEVVVKFGNRYIARSRLAAFPPPASARARREGRRRRSRHGGRRRRVVRRLVDVVGRRRPRRAARRGAAPARAGRGRRRLCGAAAAEPLRRARRSTAVLDGAPPRRGGDRRVDRARGDLRCDRDCAVHLDGDDLGRRARRRASLSARRAGAARRGPPSDRLVRHSVERGLGPHLAAWLAADGARRRRREAAAGRALSHRAGAADRVRDALRARAARAPRRADA